MKCAGRGKISSDRIWKSKREESTCHPALSPPSVNPKIDSTAAATIKNVPTKSNLLLISDASSAFKIFSALSDPSKISLLSPASWYIFKCFLEGIKKNVTNAIGKQTIGSNQKTHRQLASRRTPPRMKPETLASSPAPPKQARATCCSISPGKMWTIRLRAAGIEAAALSFNAMQCQRRCCHQLRPSHVPESTNSLMTHPNPAKALRTNKTILSCATAIPIENAPTQTSPIVKTALADQISASLPIYTPPMFVYIDQRRKRWEPQYNLISIPKKSTRQHNHPLEGHDP